MNKKLIRLGHSPDPDDAFMFYGLACGGVDAGPFGFEHILRDIQTLNDWAVQSKLEVTAISVHAYPYVQDKYAILATGASMGATELATHVPEGEGPISQTLQPPADRETAGPFPGLQLSGFAGHDPRPAPIWQPVSTPKTDRTGQRPQS